MHFDWTVSIGQVANLVLLILSGIIFLNKHLRALEKVTAVQQSMSEELKGLHKDVGQTRDSLHSIDKRMVAVETTIGIKAHWASDEKPRNP